MERDWHTSGFLPGELDNIEDRPNLLQGAPVSWFGTMLESWLQWAPDDNRGSTSFATLKDMKDALSEAGLGTSARFAFSIIIQKYWSV